MARHRARQPADTTTAPNPTPANPAHRTRAEAYAAAQAELVEVAALWAEPAGRTCSADYGGDAGGTALTRNDEGVLGRWDAGARSRGSGRVPGCVPGLAPRPHAAHPPRCGLGRRHVVGGVPPPTSNGSFLELKRYGGISGSP
jgi:hypothetical protein